MIRLITALLGQKGRETMGVKVLNKLAEEVRKSKKVVKEFKKQSSESMIDEYGRIQEKIEEMKERRGINKMQVQIDTLMKKHIKPMYTRQIEIQKTLKKSLPVGDTIAENYQAKLTNLTFLAPGKVFKKVSQNEFFEIIKVTKKDAKMVMTEKDMIKCEVETGDSKLTFKKVKK